MAQLSENDILAKYGVSSASSKEQPSFSESDILKKYGVSAPSDIQQIHSQEKSSYEGIDDDSLNFLQRLEKKAVGAGLIKPGYEMISPESLHQKGLALKTAANTATAGYLPQILGALKSGSVSNDDYLKERDAVIQDLKSAKGGTKLTGEALGLLPGLLATTPALSATTKLGKVAQAGGIGAGLGFAANPGDTEGKLDPVQLGQRTKNAATSGLLSGGLTGLAEAAPAIAEKLDKSANFRAIKQGGGMLKDFRALDNTGKLDKVANIMHEEGIISPFATTEKIAERAQKVLDTNLDKMKEVEGTLDKGFDLLKSHPDVAQNLFNPAKVADRLQKEIIDPVAGTKMEDAVGEVVSEIERLKKRGSEPLTFAEARRIKNGIDNFVNYSKEGTPQKELLKRARGIINNEIETAVDSVGKASNFPLLSEWKDAKEKYGAMTELTDIANDKIFRNTANRYISPSDYGVGLAGALATSAHHPGAIPAVIAGAAAAGANKLTRTYGNAVSSTTNKGLANFLKSDQGKQLIELIKAKAAPAGLLTQEMKNQP